ncbi:ABC transporter permease [Desulfobulbus rhabdoformis]|uniref:ABC transporter permease n=1 Tax=Desulfobulbus rhabdoformis TaxID=34032 RepID=UPI00196241EF|nr:ABC transporter permease [Desulfobulbus rhabdoformis]MBM9616361.1 ABC transporter permease [Desulfobulbus rhabdoformis]
MNFFVDSFFAAFRLIGTGDAELLKIVEVTLSVSSLATVFASAVGIPMGFLIAHSQVPGKRAVITVLNTLLALPTVVIGLFVYVFISRRGIFGPLDLLYSQEAMVIGQFILIVPLIAALTIAAVSRVDARYQKTARTLGANGWQTALVILREARFAISAAVISGFGRVISEIGISMMLGGNIKGFTRTMTTAMALEYDKGSFTLAVALGVVLMTLSLGINIIFNLIQGKSSR